MHVQRKAQHLISMVITCFRFVFLLCTWLKGPAQSKHA